jgi:hypothetical protein
MRRVLWSLALVIAAGAVPDCVCRRDATIRPELAIHVVDASGQPVAGAHVLVVHQTMPYSVIRDWWPMETGADGTVSVTALSREEAIAPLCMHGVPGHDLFVCAGKQGAGVEIIRVRDERQLELRLHDDYQDDCWNHYAYRAGGDLGWTLTTDELTRGREHVERLPAEGHWLDAGPR